MFVNFLHLYQHPSSWWSLPWFCWRWIDKIQVVFQCLYSQCSTSNFGPALHHAISRCTSDGHEFLSIHPPLIRHDGLRKRWDFEADQQSGSLLSSAFASYPTQSAGNGQTPTKVLKGPFFMPNFGLEESTVVSPYLAPVVTATSAGAASALGAIVTPGPELYTGFAPSLAINIRCPIIFTVTAIMLSI